MSLRALAKMVIPTPIRVWLRRFQAKVSIIGRYRAFRRTPLRSIQYLVKDRELDNFTYEISNRDGLITFLADSLGVSGDIAKSFMAELDGDTDLGDDIASRLVNRPRQEPTDAIRSPPGLVRHRQGPTASACR